MEIRKKLTLEKALGKIGMAQSGAFSWYDSGGGLGFPWNDDDDYYGMGGYSGADCGMVDLSQCKLESHIFEGYNLSSNRKQPQLAKRYMIQAIDLWTGDPIADRFQNELFQLRRSDPEPDLRTLKSDQWRPLIMVTWAVDR